MRNEFAGRVLPVLRSAREINRERKQVRVESNGGVKGKTRKRGVDVGSGQEKQTGRAIRRSTLVRGRGKIAAG